MKNTSKNERLGQLVTLLALFFVGNVVAMKMTEQGKARASRVMMQLKQQEIEQKELIRDGLIEAGWSQEKIRELRSRKGADGKLTYPVRYTLDSPTNLLDDILIDHYVQKLYEALAAIPVNKRGSWVDELHVMLFIGLDNYEKGGKDRFNRGLLKAINSTDDGSEIGMSGTKYQALKKVRNETNDFTTIPFNDTSVSVTPVEFFKSLMRESVTVEKPVAKKYAAAPSIVKPSKSKEEVEQESREAFMSAEDFKQKEREKQYQPGEYFIYEKGTSKGISVDKRILNKNSGFVQGMVESLEASPDEIGLDYPIDIIKVVFNVSELKNLSWDQLVKTIECSSFLLLTYGEDNPPSPVFIKVAADWINDIGVKLVDLTSELRRCKSEQQQGRSIETIQKDVPNYTVFNEVKDPFLTQAIIKQLLTINNNFFKEYTKNYNAAYGLTDKSGWNRQGSINDFFKFKDSSIVNLLNVVRKSFRVAEIECKEKQKAEKWFWQRWMGW